jgi:hypothetical protein
LASASGLFDEVIVVNTGSIDRTKELAHQSGARVFDFPWVCQEGRRFYPDDAQLLFQEAVLRNEEADPLERDRA